MYLFFVPILLPQIVKPKMKNILWQENNLIHLLKFLWQYSECIKKLWESIIYFEIPSIVESPYTQSELFPPGKIVVHDWVVVRKRTIVSTSILRGKILKLGNFLLKLKDRGIIILRHVKQFTSKLVFTTGRTIWICRVTLVMVSPIFSFVACCS